MSKSSELFEVATEINGVVFYLGPTMEDGLGDKRIVFTEDENFHIDVDEDIVRACERIYQNYYA